MKKVLGGLVGVVVAIAGLASISRCGKSSGTSADGASPRAVSSKSNGKEREGGSNPGDPRKNVGSSNGLINSLLATKAPSVPEIDRLFNLLEEVPVSSVPELWEKVNGLDIPGYHKYRLLSRLLCVMAKAGQYDEALAKAKSEENLESRSILLKGVFEGGDKPVNVMFGTYASLSEAEKAATMPGLVGNVMYRSELSVEEFKDLKGLDPQMARYLATSLSGFANMDPSRIRTVEQICKTLADQGGANKDLYTIVLTGMARQNSEVVLKEVEARAGDGLLGTTAGRDELVGALAQNSPQKTMATLLRIGDAAALQSAMAIWSKMDYGKASEWFQGNSSALDPSLRDHAASAMAQSLASQRGDLEGARKLLANVSDPQVKTALEGSLWEVERQQVQQELGDNPGAVVDSIVSGKSKHGSPWIEEVVTSWIAKEPAKAEEWYQKNWNGLSKDQQQYVAAAYAHAALRQGDVATADQWTGYIQDPKVMKKVREKIEEVQGRGN